MGRVLEIISTLLEVRAHVDVFGAQLERVHAQLERLDARAASLERLSSTRGAAASRVAPRFESAKAPRARPLTLLDLSADALDWVVASIEPDDELAASLTCRKLRDAIWSHAATRFDAAEPRWDAGSDDEPCLFETEMRSLFSSLAKLQWGVACAGAPLTAELFTFAAELGDVRMLSWLRARGCQWPETEPVKWAEDSDRGSEGPCAAAAAGGHLSALRWLHANGCRWDNYACECAAAGGHLGVLRWLRAKGCDPCDADTCSSAARGGHLAVLQWLHANGCPWDEWTCAYAAGEGHLAVLQWARAHGCAWDTRSSDLAAKSGHLAVLQWLHANGCPWNKRRCVMYAKTYGPHASVLQWLRQVPARHAHGTQPL